MRCVGSCTAVSPLTYSRIYWKFIEPAKGHYHWDLIDKALETAGQRRQTLLVRIAPYGSNADIPRRRRPMAATVQDPQFRRPGETGYCFGGKAVGSMVANRGRWLDHRGELV